MNKLIIGLLGPAGVGKDTVAQQLAFKTVHFSDALKEDCSTIVHRLVTDPSVREQKEKVRPIYIEVGRTARSIDPLYWVKRLTDTFAADPRFYPTITIADVRYLNECQWIWAQGGFVFELRRDGFGPANAEEESSFAEINRYRVDTRTLLPVIRNDSPAIAANEIKTFILQQTHLRAQHAAEALR